MSASAAPPATSPRGSPGGPLALLSNPDFVRMWVAGALVSTVRWLEMLAMGVVVFDLTGSPVQVALNAVLRMLPLGLCGILGGALAERVSRLLILQVGLGCMIVTSLTLAWLAYADRIEVWHLALGALLNGLYWVTDMPARRTLLGEIAGLARVGRAMTLDSITNNGTRMLGPLLGGLLLELLGLDGTFLLGAILYVVAIASLAGLRPPPPGPVPTETGLLRALGEGIRFAVRDRTMAGLLVITLIFNLWAFPVVTMVPVLGKDVLGLSPFPVGLLSSAEGAGALLGAMALTLFAAPRHYRVLYVSGVLVFLTSALGLAQSTSPTLSGALLLVGGIGAAGFSSMQAALVLLCAPAGLRGRMMGVLTVCIGSGPIGFVHIGALANLLGAPTAIAVSAIEGLAAIVIALLIWPELTQPQPLPDDRPRLNSREPA